MFWFGIPIPVWWYSLFKRKGKRMIVAVDLDGTLCHEGTEWWEFDKCKPKKENIERLNKEFFPKHDIIIYTARPVVDYEITQRWLKENGVKYHQLVMGKLRADLYIDNNSMRLEDEKS